MTVWSHKTLKLNNRSASLSPTAVNVSPLSAASLFTSFPFYNPWSRDPPLFTPTARAQSNSGREKKKASTKANRTMLQLLFLTAHDSCVFIVLFMLIDFLKWKFKIILNLNNTNLPACSYSFNLCGI